LHCGRYSDAGVAARETRRYQAMDFIAPRAADRRRILAMLIGVFALGFENRRQLIIRNGVDLSGGNTDGQTGGTGPDAAPALLGWGSDSAAAVGTGIVD